MTTYMSLVCGCLCSFSVSHRYQFGVLPTSFCCQGINGTFITVPAMVEWPSWCCWSWPAPSCCSGFVFPWHLWALPWLLVSWPLGGAPASLSSWVGMELWQSWQLIVYKSEFLIVWPLLLYQSSLWSRILPPCTGRQKSFIMEYLIFQITAATISVNSLLVELCCWIWAFLLRKEKAKYCFYPLLLN